MEHKTPPLGLNVSLSSYLSSFWPGNRVSSNSCSNLAMITRASNWANVCPIQFLGPNENGKNTDCWIGLLTSGENLSGLNFSGSCHASESRWNINQLIETEVPAGMKYPPMFSSLAVIRAMPAIGGWSRRPSLRLCPRNWKFPRPLYSTNWRDPSTASISWTILQNKINTLNRCWNFTSCRKALLGIGDGRGVTSYRPESQECLFAG